MNKRSHIHKKADSSASNPVQSQLQSRPFIAHAQPQSSKLLSQTETETQEFQQHNSEATKLKLQAKYGTITPEGQERLTVLQAKRSISLQKKLEHASSNGSNFANIPISRPDAPLQQAVQTKLTIGEPGDKYEQEADRVAAQVVKQINAPVYQQTGQSQPVQRDEVSEEEDELQMKPMLQLRSAKVGMSAAPDLEASIKQARGSGQPLADSIRKPMEQAIGADFSRVKVHTDSQSDQLNRSIQARAFTTGHDVFFRQGEYNPENRGGQELLAHELTHVVQQNGGAVQRKSQKEITGQTKSYTVTSLNTQVVQRVVKEIASAASKAVKRIYQQGQITNTQLANIIKTNTTGNYVTHATNQLRDELKGATNVEDRTNPGTTGDRVHFLPSLNNTYGKYIILGRKDKLGGQYNPGNGDYIVPGSVSSSKWEGFYLKEQYQEVKKALAENRDPEEA